MARNYVIRASTLLYEGKRLLDCGKTEKALIKFEDAYAIAQKYDISTAKIEYFLFKAHAYNAKEQYAEANTAFGRAFAMAVSSLQKEPDNPINCGNIVKILFLINHNLIPLAPENIPSVCERVRVCMADIQELYDQLVTNIPKYKHYTKDYFLIMSGLVALYTRLNPSIEKR